MHTHLLLYLRISQGVGKNMGRVMGMKGKHAESRS